MSSEDRGRPPWANERFELPASIPTMITPEERLYLHWLGREQWDGRSDVVEFGPWLGGSTYCLGTGMLANPRRVAGARLRAVDNFVWQEFMDATAPVGVKAGASFEAKFQERMAELGELLAVHRARLPDEPIVDVRYELDLLEDESLPLFETSMTPNPLGIVFIDGAKSWRGLVHMLGQIAPSCVPGSTLLVFQDCKVAGGYWIQMGIAKLEEVDPGGLRLRDVLEANSVAFELTPSAQPDRWRELPSSIDEVDPGEAVELMERCRALFAEAGDEVATAMVRLGEVAMLGSKDRWEDALARFRAIDGDASAAVDEADLEHLRGWLARHTGERLSPPLAKRARRLRARGAGRWARVRQPRSSDR